MRVFHLATFLMMEPDYNYMKNRGACIIVREGGGHSLPRRIIFIHQIWNNSMLLLIKPKKFHIFITARCTKLPKSENNLKINVAWLRTRRENIFGSEKSVCFDYSTSWGSRLRSECLEDLKYPSWDCSRSIACLLQDGI